MTERIFNSEFASQTNLESIEAGYINKTVAGCGLTSLAIEKEKGNTIIAVPSNELLENKVYQYPNSRYNDKLLGVNGDTELKDITEFTEKREQYKILVTYDSLHKVKHLLDDAHLVIDESDRLLSWEGMKATSKRTNVDVINSLLDTCEEYKDTVSFISATPVPVEYFGRDWLQQIPQITYYWSNTTKMQPILMHRAFPLRALKEEILRPLKNNGSVTVGGSTFKKVIVFYNSVAGVNAVVDELQLPIEECGIKCGNTVKNSAKTSITRDIKCDKLPKYLFVTSSGFSGIDLYDEEAMTVVISNTKKDWQMIDLKTDLQQAISRQRNKHNPNYNKFIFIYNQSVFELSEEELISKLESNQARITDNVALLNELCESNKERYEKTCTTFQGNTDFKGYTNFVEGKWQTNNLRFNADKYFILNTRKAYTKGFNVMSSDNNAIIVEAPTISNPTSYSSLLLKYEAQVAGEEIEFSEEELSSNNYKLIHSYYLKFGRFEDNITRAKAAVSDADKYGTLKQLLPTYFLSTKDYSAKQVKEILQGIYDSLEIKRKAKASDLLELGGKKAQTTNGDRVYRFAK